jgi:hypothetical protein
VRRLGAVVYRALAPVHRRSHPPSGQTPQQPTGSHRETPACGLPCPAEVQPVEHRLGENLVAVHRRPASGMAGSCGDAPSWVRTSRSRSAARVMSTDAVAT